MVATPTGNKNASKTPLSAIVEMRETRQTGKLKTERRLALERNVELAEERAAQHKRLAQTVVSGTGRVAFAGEDETLDF